MFVPGPQPLLNARTSRIGQYSGWTMNCPKRFGEYLPFSIVTVAQRVPAYPKHVVSTFVEARTIISWSAAACWALSPFSIRFEKSTLLAIADCKTSVAVTYGTRFVWLRL